MNHRSAKKLSSEETMPSTPKPAVVQCPSCQTKFSFDLSPIEEMNNPRFHCSRCDEIFRVEQGAISLSSDTVGSLSSDTVGSLSNGNAGSLSSDNSGEQLASSMSDANQTSEAPQPLSGLGASSEKRMAAQQGIISEPAHQPFVRKAREEGEICYDWDPPEYEEGAEEESFEQVEQTPCHDERKSSEGRSKASEPTRQQDLGITFNDSKQESSDRNLKPKRARSTEGSSRVGKRIFRKNTAPGRTSFSIDEILDATTPLPDPSEERDPKRGAPQQSSKNVENMATAARRKGVGSSKSLKPEGKASQQLLQQVETKASPQSSPSRARAVSSMPIETPTETLSGWRAAIIAGAPIMAGLLILFLTSVVLSFSGSDGRAFATLAGESYELPAADKIALLDSEFEALLLQNGEEIATVSAVIRNNSGLPFHEILVEGFVYNSNGEIVSELRQDIGHSLANTRLRSLTKEMIFDLQQQKLPVSPVLQPGESREITFVVPEFRLAEASDYSMRIFSAKEVR